ncbi:DUF6221 family protein [Streptomyces sp. NPDC057694]|uniref:DUF6221 family protein n=1 Tax=Streptomyces sp. NPDC057694 TaxID=3346216 RepID=UPI0036819560
MHDLVRWLGAQLDADTRRASSLHALDCDIHAYLQGHLESVKAAMSMFHEAPGAVCDCGVPARVLREVDAERRILARFRDALTEAESPDHLVSGPARTALLVVEPIAKDLAAVYADRPGYREEWRP